MSLGRLVQNTVRYGTYWQDPELRLVRMEDSNSGNIWVTLVSFVTKWSVLDRFSSSKVWIVPTCQSREEWARTLRV